MSESSNQFRRFAVRLFEQSGALVELIEPEGLEAMLPASLQTQLQAPEFLRLGFGPDLPPNAERASLESDWLDKCGRLLGEQGRQLRFVAGVELPPLGYAERALERGVELQNAVFRLQNVERAWTRYLILIFRYTAVSDEKREGLVKLGFNLLNGGAIDYFAGQLLSATLDSEVAEAAVKPALANLPEDWRPEKLNKVVERALPPRVRAQLGQFLTGMQRRLDRDLDRVHDYFSGLRTESFRKLKRGKTDSAREQLRLDAAEREYQSKVVDLKQKYDLKLNIELSQTLEFICPVQRVTIVIKRRKGERKLSLDWNPLARALDPPPCEWSFAAEGPRVVCDDALHLVVPAGHAPCAQCGKEYCRACSPKRCPKCGQEEEGNAKHAK